MQHDTISSLGKKVCPAFFAAVFLIALSAVGCGGEEVEDPGAGQIALAQTSNDITAEDLAAHTRALSDDRMMGRGPGQEGETVTLEYLQAAFEGIGLVPKGDPLFQVHSPDHRGFSRRSSWWASRPTLKPPGFRSRARGCSRIGPRTRARLRDADRDPEEVVDISGGVVFAGYGIHAPEEGWNDFGDTDVEGKILLVLPGEPPIEDPDRFGGEAMTYHGRWTSKIEEGARRGAAGVLLIHDPDTAAYTWEVIQGRTGERLQKTDLSVLPPRTPLQGWISGDAGERVFAAAGFHLGELAASAAQEDFSAVDLGSTATGHLDNTVRQVTSYNVVGAVEGSDPEHADEYILFVAHWDHLGVDDEVDGDGIFNGAIDNAIGTAAMLEVAEAWASAEPAPRRSALFLASTAEESGFLGVVSYIENPAEPLANTLAAINIDGVNVFGPTEDVWIVGEGLSTLEEDLTAVLEASGRYLSPDPAPEQGNFFRSDHFPFALVGIPALCVRPGMTFVGKPDGHGREVWGDYYSNRYHRPSDEFDESWDFESTAEDTQVMFEVARRVSAADAWPEWYPGNQYRAVRDAMLESAATP